MSHTPGPWKQCNAVIYSENDGLAVARVSNEHLADQPYNIQLIATTPEMLEALERARSRFVELHNGHHTLLAFEDLLVDWIDEIDKVLEKARGQA